LTKEYVAFKLKTTAPKRYSVRPALDIIPPGETKDVQVSLSVVKDPTINSKTQDTFQVQTYIVENQSVDLKNLWSDVDPADIFRHKIKSSFVPAAQNQSEVEALEAIQPYENGKAQEELTAPTPVGESVVMTRSLDPESEKKINELQTQIKKVIEEKERLQQQIALNYQANAVAYQIKHRNSEQSLYLVAFLFFMFGLIIQFLLSYLI